MRQLIAALLFLLVVTICQAQTNEQNNNFDIKLKYLGLSQEFIRQWTMDSIGCLGLRISIVKNVTNNINLKGLNIDYFMKIFGKPNYKKNDSTFTYTIYRKCDASGHPELQTTENAAWIIFYFENEKLVDWTYLDS